MDKIIAQLQKMFPHGHPDFIPTCLAEMKLHSEKNHDYAREGNPLGNFYRVAEMLQAFGYNLDPADVAFIYMLKQVDVVGRMLALGYEGQVEGIKGRLPDISVYAKLIGILCNEDS